MKVELTLREIVAAELRNLADAGQRVDAADFAKRVRNRRLPPDPGEADSAIAKGRLSLEAFREGVPYALRVRIREIVAELDPE